MYVPCEAVASEKMLLLGSDYHTCAQERKEAGKGPEMTTGKQSSTAFYPQDTLSCFYSAENETQDITHAR